MKTSTCQVAVGNLKGKGRAATVPLRVFSGSILRSCKYIRRIWLHGAIPPSLNGVCDVCRPDGDLKHLSDCQILLGPMTGSSLGWQPSLLRAALFVFTWLGTVLAVWLGTGYWLCRMDVHTPSWAVIANLYRASLLQALGLRKWCSGVLILIRWWKPGFFCCSSESLSLKSFFPVLFWLRLFIETRQLTSGACCVSSGFFSGAWSLLRHVSQLKISVKGYLFWSLSPWAFWPSHFAQKGKASLI